MSLERKPEVTYWVGFAHQTDHYQLEQELKVWSEKAGIRIEPAYDGLQVPLGQGYHERVEIQEVRTA